jgi:hypothetical protein
VQGILLTIRHEQKKQAEREAKPVGATSETILNAPLKRVGKEAK